MYNPNLLPHHEGGYFKHVDAKLAQLDVWDMDGKLITPWKCTKSSVPERSYLQMLLYTAGS